jgi:hypothetical protein
MTESFKLKGTPELEIREISLTEAANFVREHHYSKVMPKLNKEVFGLFHEDRLVGCITFGWGVRPKDTIANLFPSLDTKDYREIGKLCLLDEMPKNTESRFIAGSMKFLKMKRPELSVVFTWADAIWGKPGYIYQASNFWFGGSAASEAYRVDATKTRLHPRQLRKWLVSIGEIGSRPDERGTYVTPSDVSKNPELSKGNWLPLGALKKNTSGVRRPYEACRIRLGLSHIRGSQFRYAYFLKNEKELLVKSTVTWSRSDYPKNKDCEWKISEPGKRPREWNPPCGADGKLQIFSEAFDT